MSPHRQLYGIAKTTVSRRSAWLRAVAAAIGRRQVTTNIRSKCQSALSGCGRSRDDGSDYWSGSRNRRKFSALTATNTVDPDIDRAAI